MTVPKWWEITIGVLLIVLGISLFFFQRYSKESVKNYKKQQLIEYKKMNPKFRGGYHDAKLILPWSQRLKLTLWPLVGLSLIIIGITLSTGIVFRFFQR